MILAEAQLLGSKVRRNRPFDADIACSHIRTERRTLTDCGDRSGQGITQSVRPNINEESQVGENGIGRCLRCFQSSSRRTSATS